jgi:hypothetical protein
MNTSYIGADVDCKRTELAVERNGKVVIRDRISTDIKSLKEFLATISWLSRKDLWLVGCTVI